MPNPYTGVDVLRTQHTNDTALTLPPTATTTSLQNTHMASAGPSSSPEGTTSPSISPSPSSSAPSSSEPPSSSAASPALLGGDGSRAVEFYKAWDPWGVFSNFSPHPIDLADAPCGGTGPLSPTGPSTSSAAGPNGSTGSPQGVPQGVPQGGASLRRFASVEHFYQSQKFAGVAGAEELYESIIAAPSPEEVWVDCVCACLCWVHARGVFIVVLLYACDMVLGVCCLHMHAHTTYTFNMRPHHHAFPTASCIDNPPRTQAAGIGRRAERQQRHLLRPDWLDVKVDVMRTGLRAKFTQHSAPRALLLESGMGDHAGSLLIEASPHDMFWGRGFTGRGQNMLGKLLMELRESLLAEAQRGQAAASNREVMGVGR